MSTESASETKEKEQWADVQAKKSKSAKTDSDGGGGGKDGNKDGGGGGKGGSGGSGGAKKPHGKGKGESTNTFTEVRQFLKEVWIEFNKISWPDRQQVIRETWSVLFLVTVITVMVLGFDWVLGHVIFGPLEHWARMHGGGLGH